jgi:hypothetical protein
MATAPTPIEKVITRALKVQDCTAAELASRIGMVPTNFSLARNSKRSFPLAALLSLFNLAGLTAEEQINVLGWIAYNQVLEK